MKIIDDSEMDDEFKQEIQENINEILSDENLENVKKREKFFEDDEREQMYLNKCHICRSMN